MGSDLMSESRSQREQILAWLMTKPLSTLQARQELYVMSVAGRIFELKQQGFNITTHYIKAGTKKIAQYVLLMEVKQ
jgi:hypothetical protein